MKRLLILILISYSVFCSSQTFTLQELETYSKYDLPTFINKVMAKGYKLEKVNDENRYVLFYYEKSTLTREYRIAFYHTENKVIYDTNDKSAFISLDNEIKSKGYEYQYFKSESDSNSLLLFYMSQNYKLMKMLQVKKYLDSIYETYYSFAILKNNK